MKISFLLDLKQRWEVIAEQINSEYMKMEILNIYIDWLFRFPTYFVPLCEK